MNNTTKQHNKDASAAADKPAQIKEAIPVWEQYPNGWATMRAYADCHGKFDESSMRERNLEFRAPGRVSVADAIAIMKRALGGRSYNAFKAELLKFLPADSRVRLAREGSVCVYVETREQVDLSELCADECDIVETFDGVNTYRIWWD